MAAVAERPREVKTPPKGPPSDGWWGNGEAPHLRWPGVTIAIDAVWVPNLARRIRVNREYLWVLPNGTEIPEWWGKAGGRWESPDGAFFYDQDEADRAVEFFPTYLRHHIGEFVGQRFDLLPYQQLLLTRPIFGWKKTSDGLRRFNKVFAFIPKGGGKSPWGAGTGLYLILCDREAAAEVYAVAGDKAQARTVHDNAKIMVEESGELLELCEVLKDSIYYPGSRSKYIVLSSDAATKHGFRPHGVIFDEFHAQPDRDLYEALWKSMAKRRQPVMLIITHAGVEGEGTICYEEYEYAKRVLSGTIPDEHTLPVIFEMEPDADWTDPAVWMRVNPGHGITIKHDKIVQECLEAQHEPRKKNDFLRFHGNRWVNAAEAWIPVDWWDACDAPMPSLDELKLYQATNGTDMAQKIDLAANVTVIRLPLEDKTDGPSELDVLSEDEQTGTVIKRTVDLNYRIAILPTFWLPENTLEEHVRRDRIPYDIWCDTPLPYDLGDPAARLLNMIEGDIIDEQAIVRHVKDRKTKTGLVYQFPMLKQGQFGYDPAFATAVALQLAAMGLTTVEVLQNYAHLNEACQVMEALIKSGRVIHGGHKLLRHHVENTCVKRDDAGRIKPVKPRQSNKRIDGFVAALIGLGRLILMPPVKPFRKRSRVWTPQGFKEVVRPTPTPPAPIEGAIHVE